MHTGKESETRDLASAASALGLGLAGELFLFRRPKVFLAALALVFVPALYVLIYVSSVWDPYGHLSQLPMALVNEDVPVSRFGREVSLGRQIVQTLEQQHPFALVRYESADAARADVRAGRVFFALLIPPDFSATALASDRPAKLALYVSEGGNYTASIVSKRFGAELAHSVNEKLNRERWAALVGDAGPAETATLQQGLAALRAGGRQVRDGAKRLHEGTVQLQAGAARSVDGAGKLADGSLELEKGSLPLTGGFRQVSDAVASIRTKLPTDGQLQELTRGSESLERGAAELDQGLGQLKNGVARLDAGTGELQAGVAKVPFFGGRLAAGTAQLHDGVSTLGTGIGRAATGSGQLNAGMKKLNSAIQPLALGLTDLNAGLRTMSEKLPASAQLELFDRSMLRLREGSQTLAAALGEVNQGAIRLRDGASELESGAQKLSAGLDEAVAGFSAGLGSADAAHLAASVETMIEVAAPVPQNGPAFAPYFVALALWIGAVMMSFVFHLRRLPDFLQTAPRPARWLVKALPLLALGILQATVVVGLLKFGLGIQLAQPSAVWLIAVIGSITFVSAVLLLISLLGDAGRLLAVILLILQLSASGGIYPIELSPAFYQQVHDYLPFTFVVHAFRAAMFSAFDGRWQPDAVQLALVAAGAVLAGMLLARWKYLPAENYGPAVEF